MKKRLVQDGVFLLGLAALVLRRQMYMTAVDEKGLLVKMHPLSLALMVLTIAALVLVFLSARKREEPETVGGNGASALGHAIMAAGILFTVLPGAPRAAGYLGTAWRWLGLASPLCLLAAGAAQLGKKKPFFLLHMVPCLFFVVHIVSHYQTWSGNPQMQDYVFSLLGAMALMFFGFYTAAQEAGCGSRRMTLVMGQAAVYLCLAELANSAYPLLYLTGAIWAGTSQHGLREEQSAKEE